MAEALKAQFGEDVPVRIAAMIARVFPEFAGAEFVSETLRGYAPLELLDRGRRIAEVLHRHLPQDYPRALDVLLRSLGPPAQRTMGNGMAPFLYLPYVYFVAEHGLSHFDESIAAMHAITRRFSFEFGIRPFIERDPQRMLAVLARWTSDPDVHVRRLVSEGTRPRLPWAPRLRVFEKDPRPVLALLERLRDDPEDYVRRSVANHLNDLGKDDPALLLQTCERWARNAPPPRMRLIRHALRTLLKRGEPRALAVLGFGHGASVRLAAATITPRRPAIGASVTIEFELVSAARRVQPVLVDLRIDYARAPGAPRASRVFRLASFELAPGASRRLRKTVSLRQMSTRTHHPGRHRVEALVNGQPLALGHFVVRAPGMWHADRALPASPRPPAPRPPAPRARDPRPATPEKHRE